MIDFHRRAISDDVQGPLTVTTPYRIPCSGCQFDYFPDTNAQTGVRS